MAKCYMNLTFEQMVIFTLCMDMVLVKTVDRTMAWVDNATANSETWEMVASGQICEDGNITGKILQRLFIPSIGFPESTTNTSCDDHTHSPPSRIEIRTFTWNKATMSQAEFQHSYCNSLCVGDEGQSTSGIEGLCPDVHCFQCDCIRPQCEIYKTCCPGMSALIPSNMPSMVNRTITDDVLKFTTVGTFYHDSSETISRENLKTYDAFKNSNDTQIASNYEHTKGGARKLEPKMGCDSSSFGMAFMYVRSCLPYVPVSDEVKFRCENDAANDDISVQTIARVADNRTNDVYYNEYCAICNGMTEWHPWSVTVECLHYMRVYTATSPDELLQQSTRVNSSCRTEQLPPTGLPLVKCDMFMFSHEPIDTCNVTGLWPEYDRDVEEGCHSLTSLIYRVYDDPRYSDIDRPRQLFQNIFCAICNKKSYPTYRLCAVYNDRLINPKLRPPFSILLGIKKESPETESVPSKKCSNTEWLSPNGSCLPLHCSPGKILVGGVCETGLKQIVGLGYRLRLWFLRLEDNATKTRHRISTPPAVVIAKRFSEKLHSKLSPAVNKTLLIVSAVVNMSEMIDFYGRSTPPTHFSLTTDMTYTWTIPNTTIGALYSTTSMEEDRLRMFDFQVPFGYWVTGDVVASNNKTRDAFEEDLKRKVLRETLEVEFEYGVNGSFQPVVMWADHDPEVFCAHVRKSHPEIECYQSITNHEENGNEDSSKSCMADRNYFLNFSEILTCSYLVLHPSMFTVEETMKGVLPKVILKVNFSGVNITFSSESDLNKMSLGTNGTLNLCLELFDNYHYTPQFISDSNSERLLVLYVLSVLCVSISMACLLIALGTYVMFPVLRSVAGRNNMCLCTSLVLAQAALLASSSVSPDHGAVCLVIGIATHFLWLSVMCWSFLCCLHMLQVFTSKTRSSYSTTRSRSVFLAKNLACSLLLPTAVVVAVVVVMYTTSGGQCIGYGGDVCYLSSNILVGTVAVLPLLSVSLINFGFFLVTIVHIHRVRKLQKHESFQKCDIQHLYVYIKLSTMTGSFWLLSITGEVLDIDAVRISGILLNGLQGLFIFCSYICNKRVLTLYLRRLGIDSTDPTTMTASSTDGSTRMRFTTKLTQETQRKPSSEGTTVCPDGLKLEDAVEAEESSLQEASSRGSTGKEQASIFVCEYQESSVCMRETDNIGDGGFVNPMFSSDGNLKP